DYKGVLPYASELFGICQPLLGWKSRIIQRRYDRFRASLYGQLANRVLGGVRTPVEVKLTAAGGSVLSPEAAGATFEVSKLAPIDLSRASEAFVSKTIATIPIRARRHAS